MYEVYDFAESPLTMDDAPIVAHVPDNDPGQALQAFTAQQSKETLESGYTWIVEPLLGPHGNHYGYTVHFVDDSTEQLTGMPVVEIKKA